MQTFNWLPVSNAVCSLSRATSMICLTSGRIISRITTGKAVDVVDGTSNLSSWPLHCSRPQNKVLWINYWWYDDIDAYYQWNVIRRYECYKSWCLMYALIPCCTPWHLETLRTYYHGNLAIVSAGHQIIWTSFLHPQRYLWLFLFLLTNVRIYRWLWIKASGCKGKLSRTHAAVRLALGNVIWLYVARTVSHQWRKLWPRDRKARYDFGGKPFHDAGLRVFSLDWFSNHFLLFSIFQVENNIS